MRAVPTIPVGYSSWPWSTLTLSQKKIFAYPMLSFYSEPRCPLQRENIQKGSQSGSLFFLFMVQIKALSAFLLLAPQGMRNKWWLLRAGSHPSFFSGLDALEIFGWQSTALRLLSQCNLEDLFALDLVKMMLTWITIKYTPEGFCKAFYKAFILQVQLSHFNVLWLPPQNQISFILLNSSHSPVVRKAFPLMNSLWHKPHFLAWYT